MQVIGYTRVSTDDQAESGLGLRSQRAAIEKACAERGWELVSVLSDSASGAGLDREGLQAALRECDAGNVAGLVVAKLDRLSRSIIDFAGLVERARTKGWAVIALDLGVDTSTPQGEMVANVMATFAQFERRIIGQRTKDALAVKRSQGVRLGRPPTVDPRVVQRIKLLRSRGHSYGAIAERFNDEGVATTHGGAKWHPATVRKMLLGMHQMRLADSPSSRASKRDRQ